MADKAILENNAKPTQNEGNYSSNVLHEVFEHLERDIYLNWREKFRTILALLNKDQFRNRAQPKITDTVKKLNESINHLKEKYNKLKSEVTKAFEESVFKGLKALKDNLKDILEDDLLSDVMDIDIYDLLLTKIPESVDKLCDENKSENQRINELYSLLFEKTRDANNNNRNTVYEKDHAHAYDITNRIDENMSEHRNVSPLNIDIKNEILNKLTQHFKPLEKELTKIHNAKKGVNFGGGAGLAVASAFNPLIAIVGAVGLLIANVAAEQNHYVQRSHPDWYMKLETTILKYLNDKISDDNMNITIEKEQLESDRDIFCEYVNSFFSAYNFDNFINQKKERYDDIKLRRFHVEGICLIYDLAWYFIKASIFQDKALWDKVKEINENIKRITERLNTDDYFPLVSLDISNNNARQNNDKINFKIVGADNSIFKEIKNLFGVTVLDNNEISVDRSLFNSVLRFLTMSSDFRTKGVLIRNYKIAIGTQVLNPRFNRIYGPSYIPEKDDVERSSFMQTSFGYLTYSGKRYYCPNGWRRYSLNVTESSQEFDRKYGGWPVAYHGTASYNLMNILKTGFYEADIAVYGNGWYFSQSIEYCGHPRYAKVMKLGNCYVQTVLQCRLNPILFEQNQIVVKEGTLNGSRSTDPRLDPNFSNSEVEWILLKENIGALSKKHDLLVIYGLMLRISKDDPKNLPCNKWWGNINA